MKTPFEALVFPAPTGIEPIYRPSCLVDSKTGLPILLPHIPGMETMETSASKETGSVFKNVDKKSKV